MRLYRVLQGFYTLKCLGLTALGLTGSGGLFALRALRVLGFRALGL